MNLEDKTILVIGDIMIDRYTVGSVDRISPEAPVPVVKVTNEYCNLGGCGNVVRNLRSIGVQAACLSVVGEDLESDEVINQLNDIGADPLIVREAKRTTVKERIVANSRMTQMLRVDREIVEPISFEKLIYPLSLYLKNNKVDVILVSDYAKGVISKELMNFLKEEKYIIIADPKPINADFYTDLYMITPNEKEWNEMTKNPFVYFNSNKYILVTKGSRGMELQDFDKNWDIPTEPVEIYNVSGAGDTVLAVMGVCKSLGLESLMSARIANQCARYVVQRPGTTSVPQNIFMNTFRDIQ